MTIIPYPLQLLVKLPYPMDRDYVRVVSVLCFEPRPNYPEALADEARTNFHIIPRRGQLASPAAPVRLDRG